MIEYWHWHTLHFGTETYWGGILPHSQEPGRVYRELAELGAELKTAGDRVTELTPHTDVEILWSTESKWAQNEEPSLGTVMTPDRRSYHTMVDAFARGTFDAGPQSGIVHSRRLAEAAPEQYATEHPVLVAAGFTIADDTQLQWLERCRRRTPHRRYPYRIRGRGTTRPPRTQTRTPHHRRRHLV